MIGGGEKLGTKPSDVISGRDGIRSKIWSIRVEGTANNRPVQNLVGIFVLNLKVIRCPTCLENPTKYPKDSGESEGNVVSCCL